jgi:hypothetical protein
MHGYEENLVAAMTVDENTDIPNAIEYGIQEFHQANKNCRLKIYLETQLP